MIDRTTKLLLAAVAAGLFLNAAAALVPVAHAADTTCRIEGPIEVRPIEVRITEVRDAVPLEWGFSQPGSSSSSPLYVRQAN